MATMKRRVIYMADEDWERLREMTAAGVTISELIRRQVTNISVKASVTGSPAQLADAFKQFRPVPKPSQKR